MTFGFCNDDKCVFLRTAEKVCFYPPVCNTPNLNVLGFGVFYEIEERAGK